MELIALVLLLIGIVCLPVALVVIGLSMLAVVIETIKRNEEANE